MEHCSSIISSTSTQFDALSSAKPKQFTDERKLLGKKIPFLVNTHLISQMCYDIDCLKMDASKNETDIKQVNLELPETSAQPGNLQVKVLPNKAVQIPGKQSRNKTDFHTHLRKRCRIFTIFEENDVKIATEQGKMSVSEVGLANTQANDLQNIEMGTSLFNKVKYDIDVNSKVLYSQNLPNYEGATSGLTHQNVSPTRKSLSSKSCLTFAEAPLSLVIKKDNDLSVRDVAVASTSEKIVFIDADDDNDDDDCLDYLPLSPTVNYKTDAGKHDSKLYDSKVVLENIYKTFAAANFIINDTSFLQTMLPKSSLKKFTAEPPNKKQKKKKKKVCFTNVSIFYFERCQGFLSIPTKGGSTLGMTERHFYVNTLSVDEYEYTKVKRCLPRLKKSNVISYRWKEKLKSIEALSVIERLDLLQSSFVKLEVAEDEDCACIRSSRARAGCDCKDYCDPEICFCCLSEIECQVDRPGFPCGCTKENCKNSVGRIEYNHNQVKTHYLKTVRKMKMESRGRCPKAKYTSIYGDLVVNDRRKK